MARFNPEASEAAGPTVPLRKLSTADNQSDDESAAAVPGIEANADPMPNPKANSPSRAAARVPFK
jgi:hypothetical protein